MASSMITSEADIAKLINLNPQDSAAYFDVVTAYFGEREIDEDDPSGDEDPDRDPETTTPREDTHDNFEAVTTDPAEAIVPLDRGCHDAAEQSAPSTSTDTMETDTVTPKPIPCSCKGTPCHVNFSREVIENCRLQYLAMTGSELDISVLSKIECGIHLDSMTRKSKKAQQTERKSTRTDYFHHGSKICLTLFKYIHAIGHEKLYALIKHYKANGVEARIHANSKRLPKKALSYKETRMVVDFILNYAEIHAIHLPGRTPKHWVSDVQLLPSDCTKTSVYEAYKASAQAGNVRVVKLRTFQMLWQKLVPFVRTMPPASDLCWTCQQSTNRINAASNREEEKTRILAEFHEHLSVVKQERLYYKTVCENIKQQLPVGRLPGNYAHCSFEGKHHASFDFAQQMHFPSDPQQPGPIYFKTPRKCGLFGVNSEGLNTQLNYLIDEAHSSGKGANVVISYIHDFLENHSLGETDLHLHADNCSGQNKNNSMIWYLLWRCVTNRHRTIRLSFLIAGHTKFSPDGGFGLIKKRLRHTKVDCLQDILDVVNNSATMNTGKLIGSENGPTEVPTYDWAKYLSSFFSKIQGLLSYHHFCMDVSGSVTVQKHSQSPSTSFNIMKKVPEPNTMPDLIPAPGLSAQRQAYLFKEIRPFVAEDKQDITTPEPTIPLLVPTNDSGSSSEDSEDDASPPPAKKRNDNPRPGVLNRGRGRGRGRAAATKRQ